MWINNKKTEKLQDWIREIQCDVGSIKISHLFATIDGF